MAVRNQFMCTVYFDEVPTQEKLNLCMKNIFRVVGDVEFPSLREVTIYFPSNLRFDALFDLASHLHRSISRYGLRTSIGVASTQTVARAAARTRAFQVTVVEPGEEEKFLGKLPIESIPAFGRHTQTAFRELGLRRVSQLQRISEAHFVRLFGPSGKKLSQLAHGQDLYQTQNALVYHTAPRTIKGTLRDIFQSLKFAPAR